ncbi:MAG: prepilin-type N-terminal cleavage/methylation domain-containing protein [Candidatus Riflebacteria bacterium]|nr:prepilin-type N-terminal cleavage/methylation domain-containing protein [Candidatus Riflebacteria bacterium]
MFQKHLQEQKKQQTETHLVHAAAAKNTRNAAVDKGLAIKGKARFGVSLVEIMVALTILSMLALPGFMFLFEYLRGGSELGEYHQVINLLEKKLELACALDFSSIPVGETSDKLIEGANGRKLDLRPSEISKNLVQFKMKVDVLPLSFSAIENPAFKQLQRARAESSYKKIEVFAQWGKNGRHRLNLLTYKADL